MLWHARSPPTAASLLATSYAALAALPFVHLYTCEYSCHLERALFVLIVQNILNALPFVHLCTCEYSGMERFFCVDGTANLQALSFFFKQALKKIKFALMSVPQACKQAY